MAFLKKIFILRNLKLKVLEKPKYFVKEFIHVQK